MPFAYGYARACSQRQCDEGLSLEAQQLDLPKIAAEKFPDYEYKGTYWDSQSASVLAFSSRKEGRKLNDLLERGDVLIVMKADRIFRSLKDHACSNRLYGHLGVTVYIAKQGA